MLSVTTSGSLNIWNILSSVFATFCPVIGMYSLHCSSILSLTNWNQRCLSPGFVYDTFLHVSTAAPLVTVAKNYTYPDVNSRKNLQMNLLVRRNCNLKFELVVIRHNTVTLALAQIRLYSK